MYEPLLDVGIPDDIAWAGSSFVSGEKDMEKVIVIQQVYINEQSQENVRTVCKILSEDAGIRLIAVEGADDVVRPRSEAYSVRALLQRRCRISAGVEVFLNVDRPAVEVWGVD